MLQDLLDAEKARFRHLLADEVRAEEGAHSFRERPILVHGRDDVVLDRADIPRLQVRELVAEGAFASPWRPALINSWEFSSFLDCSCG